MKKNIRLGQLLSPFGIGQIVNFPNDESLMITGLDAWDQAIQNRKNISGADHINEAAFMIREPRLSSLLGVPAFRKPFPYRESATENTRLTIPAVRFPGWHYCIDCGRMEKVSLTHQDPPVCFDGNCKGKLIPVRFVAVCPFGHIQDVPFEEWVHGGIRPTEGKHIMKYEAGKGAGDLSSIVIKCSCGDSRTLGGLLNEKALNNITKCQGHRPWLGTQGIENNEQCDGELRVLIRGGSNVHYAVIRSALYLPETSEGTPSIVNRVIDNHEASIRKMAGLDNDHTALKMLLSTVTEVETGQINEEELYRWVSEYLNGPSNQVEIETETDLRFQEYEYLIRGRDSENSDFKAVTKSLSGYSNGEFLSKVFEKLVLVEKLKETRVFVGFSRLNPEDGRSLSQKINSLGLSGSKWLPANVVFGEGIFIQFRDGIIDSWLNNLDNQGLPTIERYHHQRRQRWPEYENRDLNPAFIMMHTFAHMLINRLCFNCGYGSSSLRERIYFSSESDKRMNGILIYTSSGDSEGSMGGLVRQGREAYFGQLVRDVIEDARWCSADPVCMDLGSSVGQGPGSVNGAACHNCAIVPETSCEEFNMLLDRGLLVNSSDRSMPGFFEIYLG